MTLAFLTGDHAASIGWRYVPPAVTERARAANGTRP